MAAVASVCADYGLSPVFRMTPDDLAEPDIDDVGREMPDECGAQAADADFVVDIGYIATTGRSVITARGALAAVPFAADWAALALVAGSFPENLSGFAVATHIVERHEWAVWPVNRNAAGRVVRTREHGFMLPSLRLNGIEKRRDFKHHQ